MKQLIFPVFLIVFFACNKPKKCVNEITKIEIATGGCFGSCQLTTTIIDSSLMYRYFGSKAFSDSDPRSRQDKKLVGYYSGRVSSAFWDSLNIKLEQINYKKLDTVYEHSVDDESLEVIIHYSNKVKHINAQSMSLPESVANVFYYIIRSYRVVNPKPTTDTFKVAYRPSPMRNVRDVRFPPPSKAELKTKLE